MKIRETVSQVIAENEKSFKDIPEARAAKLVQLTLQQIATQISDTAEGRVSIQGLGVFIIKNVEREKEGVKSTVKRVTFRAKGEGAATGGEGKAAKGAGGGRKARAEAESGDGEQAAAKTGDQAARKAARQAARKATGRQGARKGGGRNKAEDE